MKLSVCIYAVILFFASGQPAVVQAQVPNPVTAENAKPGSGDWQLTRVRVDKDGFRSPWIEGYCNRQSVKAGQTIEFKVSTDPPRPFRIEIFRMGYYGGKGARKLAELGPIQGQAQPLPQPDDRRLIECRWQTSASLTIPPEWLSGVYLGRLTTVVDETKEPYWQSYLVFVVTDDRPAQVLFQCSDNTWQAYNRWPNNYSVYTHPRDEQGPWSDSGFDRPYGREAQYSNIVNDPLTIGSGEFLPFEFPLAYWLEREGYDVAYCTNSDMLRPDRGFKCKAFVSVGHDEYWDIRQFRSVTALRDAGVSLLFFSGNAVCWVSPYRPSKDGRPNRVISRGGPYGGGHAHAVQRERQHGPFPERGPDEGLLMGVRNVEPVMGGGDWIILKPEHWMFEGTGVRKGDRIPGLIGWEFHGDPAAIPGLEVVAGGKAWLGGVAPKDWAATIYPGPKGNFVWSASTIFWAQGLASPPGHMLPWSHFSRPHGPDDRVQRITRNLLERALRTAPAASAQPSS